MNTAASRVTAQTEPATLSDESWSFVLKTVTHQRPLLLRLDVASLDEATVSDTGENGRKHKSAAVLGSSFTQLHREFGLVI